MIWLYRFLFPPLLLLALPRYLYRMWRRGGYRDGLSNRFGRMANIPAKTPGVKRIWVQASSVGENLAIQPLLQRLHANGHELILTVTTSTGRSLAQNASSHYTRWIGFFPLDFWPFSRAAWKAIEPDMAILAESELWPEHLRQARNRNVPVVLVNARLSDRSYRRYRRFRKIARFFFDEVDTILASTQQNLERFEELGLGRKRKLAGNLKFDVAIQPLSVESIESIRQDLSEDAHSFADQGPWILGASTWPGEELALVRACKAIRAQQQGDLRLVIVPRHAERRGDVERDLKAEGVAFQLRSRAARRQPQNWVYVADTTGELRRFVELADIVFVGKSLPPHREGQTPIEAAAAGKAILLGPGMSNFREAARSLVLANAALKVADAETLREAIDRLIAEPDRRRNMGAEAQTLFRANVGATEKVVAEIESHWEPGS